VTPGRHASTAVLAALLVAGTAGCTGPDTLTLGELGAPELAGWNGPTVADQCGELPRPTAVRSSGCGRGPSVGQANNPQPPGDYVIVLLCEGPGTYRLEATKPADAFDAFEVECSDDDDPAVGPRFTVPEPGIESMYESFDGENQNVAMLLRVPDGV
jgi:hypothetical protein